ncbi:Diamine acetyltransferase, partial [Bienertia sinuspersici]
VKNEGKCSRVDVLVESHTRKSKKAVNALTLEKNNLAVVTEKAKKEAKAIRNDVDRKIE